MYTNAVVGISLSSTESDRTLFVSVPCSVVAKKLLDLLPLLCDCKVLLSKWLPCEMLPSPCFSFSDAKEIASFSLDRMGAVVAVVLAVSEALFSSFVSGWISRMSLLLGCDALLELRSDDRKWSCLHSGQLKDFGSTPPSRSTHPW